MKFRLDYTKKGSEEVVDRLSVYIEKWRLRKLREQRRRQPAVYEARKRNTHKIAADEVAPRSAAQTAGREDPPLRRAGTFLAEKKSSAPKRFSRALEFPCLPFYLRLFCLRLPLISSCCMDRRRLRGNRFVLTVTETSAGKFLATWFLSDETVPGDCRGKRRNRQRLDHGYDADQASGGESGNGSGKSRTDNGSEQHRAD